LAVYFHSSALDSPRSSRKRRYYKHLLYITILGAEATRLWEADEWRLVAQLNISALII